jgi:hypothetical protein
MRKLLLFASVAVLTALLAFAFTACGDDEDVTTLKINNLSNYILERVSYGTTNFGDINSFTEREREVTPGKRFILFELRITGQRHNLRTLVAVDCYDGEHTDFTFTNTTEVETVNGSRTGTLQSVYNALSDGTGGGDLPPGPGPRPQIRIEYDVGSRTYNVSQNSMVSSPFNYGLHDSITSAKAMEFYIMNIGQANLILESVGGRRVNLENNTSGFFSITFQPHVGTIAPGNETGFEIRYMPTSMGTHTATVRIRSNSENHGDLTFRVSGSRSWW